jgi:hypothetical protein
MNIAERISALPLSDGHETMTNDKQLEMADEIEKTLSEMGIEVQPRFDIALARRLCSIPSDKKK